MVYKVSVGKHGWQAEVIVQPAASLSPLPLGGIPSGIYIARLVTPEYTKSIKILLLKSGVWFVELAGKRIQTGLDRTLFTIAR